MEFLQSAALVFFQAAKENTEIVEDTRKCWFSCLDESVLLDVFSFLSITDLLRASRVCKQWNRVTKDGELWTKVDLSPLGAHLKGDGDLDNFLNTIPMSRLRELNLSGLTVRGDVFTTLTARCPRLKKLILKSTKLRLNSDAKSNKTRTFLFPSELDYLDLRFSNGDPEVYLTMASSIRYAKWVGVSDALIYALFSNGRLESTFQNLPNLRSLDTSHCLLAKDSLLSIIASCRGLEVLSMRKCISVKGFALEELLSNCQNLKVLILDGTSLDDVVMTSLPWERSLALECLELGWCPLISAKGLRTVLPKLARNPALDYLGFQSIGNGNAKNDKVLDDISRLNFRGLFKNLKTLNAGSLKCYTKTCLTGFSGKHPDIELTLEGHLANKNSASVVTAKCKSNQSKSAGRKCERDRTWSQHYLETPV